MRGWLWSVTEPNQKNRKERMVRSANRRPEQRGGKGVPLLEVDGLETGESLPTILSCQKMKPPNANLGSTPQLSSPMGFNIKPPTAHLLASILIPHLSFPLMRLPICCLCALGISVCSKARLSPEVRPRSDSGKEPGESINYG